MFLYVESACALKRTLDSWITSGSFSGGAIHLV